MCRWLAYSGSPVTLDELLYKPANSLVMQSRHSRLGVEPMNGDGFGVGWYDGHAPNPGLFRSVEPAWSDRNLQELARHVRSGVVLAHIRATTGTAVQQTNCHPFRHGQWLWMHNGVIDRFLELKRDLQLAVAPDLFPHIEGTTDSETLFHLALSFGLTDDPPSAVAAAVGVVEDVARAHGVPFPVQGTFATTDGRHVWAFRYSSEGRSRSLFRNADVTVLRQQYPDNPVLHDLADDTRLVVSEPLGDLRGAWLEVPESTCLVIGDGVDELVPFAPRPPG
ncbi:class II glutamine amidotransferase [Cellulomonas fimi]|uniref:Glutamine amidotransferase class-II n=1 Tax=Cellulomonas fimi (strain ATCC 484 / DSM 20113 / JCM 1341 / CCUG 24087 / LMG 16345 / NBRC 15513 / NCIMB 8980 / NCTC 7547 / NRS-133) TaxID=590998 RepID=F4H714_CELFA|nr:class II glutamine amidotransferase [Cellulomonas fimi]AEE44523.1 glutamine amidotransferase class-II [Cellulomonas fimi ATCC 484]NNH06501.1 class II glutamine amidotransferase [Cellulomonas fimi]VEH26533.1 Amidohydrolase EgtC [Cellulomonas fimi]